MYKQASKLGAAALVMALLVAVAVLAAPGAQAQTTSYAALVKVADGQACPSGHTLRGTVSSNSSDRWCSPDGFSRTVTTQAKCNEAGAQGVQATLRDGVCVGGFNFILSPGETCGAPALAITTVTFGELCGGPVYEFGGGSVGDVSIPTPACIEEAIVQNSPAAAKLRVGSTFTGTDGVLYLIATGAPTCEFNCHHGHDANCDDILGDYCSSELELNRVADVRECLVTLVKKS